MGMKQNQMRWMIIIICVVILISGPGHYLFDLGSFGYTSGYEGVKASFSGLEWQYEQETGTMDLEAMSFTFDADDPSKYACNIVGEMTNAFVPESSLSFPSWVPQDFLKSVGYIDNPKETYTWDLPDPTQPNTTIAYVMEEWILKMYVSITAEWDEEAWWYLHGTGEVDNRRYQNTKLWIQLDVSPIWYFEDATEVYFAIGKVTCSDFAWGKLGKTEEDYEKTIWASVAPESEGSYRYLYYQNYGKAGQVDEFDPHSHQGRILNPSLFTDKVYMKLDLNNFGTFYDIVYGKKGDAATWGFDVHVFVVGEWKVQDVEPIPDGFGREERLQKSWIQLLWEDPRLPLFSFIALIAIIVLALMIFAPWVVFGTIGMLRSKK